MTKREKSEDSALGVGGFADFAIAFIFSSHGWENFGGNEHDCSFHDFSAFWLCRL